MYVYMYRNTSVSNSLFKEEITMETGKCLELKAMKVLYGKLVGRS